MIGKRQLLMLITGLPLLFAFCGEQPRKVRIWLIGDSTMCVYEDDRAPLAGWGMPFAAFFDSSVAVHNHAKGGRSTRTFITEGRWQAVVDSIEQGDYVLMQFGHNDEAKEEKYKDRYTPVPDYKLNLQKFITETEQRKAIPVIITPVSRLRFDASGKALETHTEYSTAAREVAAAQEITLIDLDSASTVLYQDMGPSAAKLLFMQLDPMEHPNYPEGQKDNTHFNDYGARRIAELVLHRIRNQEPGLAAHIIKPALIK